ncbi:chemotaxis protein CheW [Amorphus sp. 3PC139-8]|uniref:chemotaxis protein CheW n=1 Tax=Amorphus sp. 3PC139-8 TaxID=2735676 RepID=UPI00345D6261
MGEADDPTEAADFDWAAARARIERLGEPRQQDDAEVLRRRAKRLADARPRSDIEGPSLEVLRFERCDVRYALPSLQCAETVRTEGALQVLPSVPPFVLAVMLNRGKVTPILETKWFLDGEGDATMPAFAVVANIDRAVFALAADAVLGVERIRRPAEPTASSVFGAHFVTGMTDDLATVLDLVGLAGDARFRIDQQAEMRTTHTEAGA